MLLFRKWTTDLPAPLFMFWKPSCKTEQWVWENILTLQVKRAGLYYAIFAWLLPRVNNNNNNFPIAVICKSHITSPQKSVAANPKLIYFGALKGFPINKKRTAIDWKFSRYFGIFFVFLATKILEKWLFLSVIIIRLSSCTVFCEP